WGILAIPREGGTPEARPRVQPAPADSLPLIRAPVCATVGRDPYDRVRQMMRWLRGLLVTSLIGAAACARNASRTRNVVLVVTDGLRWQDVFGGADSSIIFGDRR